MRMRARLWRRLHRRGRSDFEEIGFGSSGAWSTVDQAMHMAQSAVENREWETEPGHPEPEEVVVGDCAAEECEHDDVCPTELVDICIGCWNLCEESYSHFGEQGVEPVLWPCSTIRAVDAALGGEGE